MGTDRRNGDVDTEEVATTIGLYVLGEISLGKVAEREGLTRWEMLEFLANNGVELCLGPTDMEDAAEETRNARGFE